MTGWRFQAWWQYCGAENLHSSKVESRCTKSKHNYRIKTYSANLANRSHVNFRLRCSCVNVTNHEQCTGNYCWQSNGQCRGWDRPNPTDKCNIAILQKWPHIVSVIFVYVYFIYLFIYLFIYSVKLIVERNVFCVALFFSRFDTKCWDKCVSKTQTRHTGGALPRGGGLPPVTYIFRKPSSRWR